jgi:hypothetical protein
MVSFLSAFLFVCFESSDLITRMLVAVLWAAIAVLILWCVVNAWESNDWAWLRSVLWWPNAAERGQDAAEETKSTASASESKPRKRRWALFKRHFDTKRTVNV